MTETKIRYTICSKLVQVVPLLCSSTSTPYAKQLKQQLKAAVPSAVIEENFLAPTDLAMLFTRTILNIHPPETDAYGMTIVEAASQGKDLWTRQND